MPDRRVPISLKSKLKNELDRLVELNVIAPIDEPTEWVSQIVLAKKPNGDVRLCIDPQELNKVIIRERYTLPTLEDSLHELAKSKVFSKTDLASGYWHVKLDEASSKLTTFQTCFGRFRFLRLPFGVSTSAEIFQKKLTQTLQGLKGVICFVDDIIIHGENEKDHDENMKNFLNRCKEEGKIIKLNEKKTFNKVNSVSFMGHKISKQGLEVDESKVKAISEFPNPKNVSQLRTFLGMVNFLGKFIPNMTNILHPLHNLLKNGIEWTWTQSQEDAFIKIKKMIVDSTKLATYDEKQDLVLENDASEFGLGSVILQNNKPIAYASRALSDCERNYAQIEKEMLAIVFGLKKFHHYVYGRHVTIVTDHKHLTSIVLKPLSKAPKRIQCMLMKIQDYNFDLMHKPGTSIPIADALSRNPVEKPESVNLVSNLEGSPLNETRFLQIKEATAKDATLVKLKQTISRGWPSSKDNLDPELCPYFNFRDEMTLEDGIILRGDRLVIPASLRFDMKNKIHGGHLDIKSCLCRARTYIYWPGMSKEIRQFVEQCSTCASLQNKQAPQPLHLHKIPQRPWEKIGIDIFTIKGRNYLITVDYYSQFFEVDFLKDDLTSTNIISKLKAHIARYGIPEKIISDNGPQLVSKEFQHFCSTYTIQHETISPGNSKSNGQSEAAVKIAKNLMKKCNLNSEDPYIALLNYRNTPQEGIDYSPAQRLMGRRTKTLLPTNPILLNPETVEKKKLEMQRERKQFLMSEKFSHRKHMCPLKTNDHVRMQPIQEQQKLWKPATVKKQINARSYIVETEYGKLFKRNREHLRLQKEPATSAAQCANATATPLLDSTASNATSNHPQRSLDDSTSRQSQPSELKEEYTTRFGRSIKKPIRYQ